MIEYLRPLLRLGSLLLLATTALSQRSARTELPDLTLGNTNSFNNQQTVDTDRSVHLRWTAVNLGKGTSPSANISIFLTQNDGNATLSPLPRTRARAGRIDALTGTRTSGPQYLGGTLVYQATTGQLHSKSSKEFIANFSLPRTFEDGSYNLIIAIDGQSRISETNENNNLMVVPITLANRGSNLVTLDFEGAADGQFIPGNFYQQVGVELVNLIALVAGNLGGSGYFCDIHSLSPTVGYASVAAANSPNRVIINVPNGFSDLDMNYAQSEETVGGFRVWSGPNGTGSVQYTYFFFSHPDNGFGEVCGYNVWYNTDVIQVAGKSIEFFENDMTSTESWFLFDKVTFTPARNEIVLFDDPVLPREGESDGHTFRIALSDPIPSGQSVTIKVERTSPSAPGEDIKVIGVNAVTFTSGNWNIPKPLSIWAPENDDDATNQTAEFRLYRSSGSSTQTIEDRFFSVTEIDDDFQLTVGVSTDPDLGTVEPTFEDMFFDFYDDDWASMLFTATPETGYMFSEWSATASGVNNDSFFLLTGTTQNPAQISQLALDSGGTTTLSILAGFTELGPVTISMSHDGTGSTRLNNQLIGDGQSAQIEPLEDVPLSATAAPGWAFGGWASDPEGIIADPTAQITTINTSVDSSVTATFFLAPVTLDVFHNGDGSTTINGTTVGSNQSIEIPSGENVPISAEADTEWEFSFWSSNPSGIVGNPNSASTVINAAGDATLTAHFDFVGTRFRVESGSGGTTDPSGTQFVNSGDTVLVTVIPDENFVFEDWNIITGNPQIEPVSGDPNQFEITISEATTIRATFEEQTPGKLLIRATNLQDNRTYLLREPDAFVQVLQFEKNQGGSPNTYKLEFFNEGDLPLVITHVTLMDRLPPLPSLNDSGFCLMQTPNFNGLECQIQQPLSTDPLPKYGSDDSAPKLYLDFGREPGFPDVPNPDPEFYSGSLAYLENLNVEFLVFDFIGLVLGSADVSSIELEKTSPEPMVSIPNGGVVTVDPQRAGSELQISFKLTNNDTENPFFADKGVLNTNDGNINPNQYGFFFEDTTSITVPKDGEVSFNMKLKSKSIGPDEPAVRYTAQVQLGTGSNLYRFNISAVTDGTAVEVKAVVPGVDAQGNPNETLVPVSEGSTYIPMPRAPESGSIYEFVVINKSNTKELDVSNLHFEFVTPDVYSIYQSQSDLPGVIQPGGQSRFSVLMEGNAQPEAYFNNLIFDYRTPGGPFTSFSFGLLGTIGNEFLNVFEDQEIVFPQVEIPFNPSNIGQTQSKFFEIRHTGNISDPDLVGSIDPDIHPAFNISNPNFTIQPGEVHQFRVDFTAPSAGNFEGLVAIESNDPVLESFVVTMEGIVFEPGAAPTQVPNFVGRINGDSINGLTIYDTDPVIDFTWDDALSPVGIAQYQIVVQPLQGPWLYAPKFTTPVNAASIQTENLVLGWSYSIHIRAQDTDGVWGPFNNRGSFTVSEPGPPSEVPNFLGRIGGQAIVEGLEIQDTTPEILFTWDHATSPLGINAYQIVLKPVDGPWLQSQTLAFPTTEHTMVAPQLTPGTSYSIHIRARDIENTWGPFNNGGTFRVIDILPPSSVPGFVGRIDGQNVDGLSVQVTNPTVDFTWSHATSHLPLRRYQIVIQATDGSGWLYSPKVNFPATSHSIATSGLEIGKSYSVHIRAENEAGMWGVFNNGGAFTVEEPGPPSHVPGFVGLIDGQNVDGLTVQITHPQIDFTWNHPSSALPLRRYQIVVKKTDGGWIYSPKVNHPNTSHTINTANLEVGSSYSIHIRAENNAGDWGPFNNGGVFAVEEPGPPSQVPQFVGRINNQNVAGLTINTTDPAVVFTWDHASSALGIATYQIVIQPTDGSGWLYAPLIAFPLNNHTIQTSGLEYGKSYSIHIRARDNAGTWGLFNNGGTFNVVEPVPPKVLGFRGKFNGLLLNTLVIPDTQPLLDFDWVASSDPTGIERYQIVIQPTDGSGWLYSPQILAPATSHAIQTSNLVPGMSYTFHIRAKNNLGNWGPFNNGGTFYIQ